MLRRIVGLAPGTHRLPAGTLSETAIASVALVLPLAMVPVEGVTVTPVGAPSTLMDTAPAKEPVRATSTVAVPDPACTIVVGVVPETLKV